MSVTPALQAMYTASGQLPPTSLSEVLTYADLQVRTDRKYMVPVDIFEQFVASIAPRSRILQIDQRRVFRYDSVYFDTPDLRAYQLHATGRRQRFKVRTRTYLDSNLSVLEVKTEGGRDETIKDRLPYHYADRHLLTNEGLSFVAARLDESVDATSLQTAVATAYRRMTMVDPSGGTRVTCDAQLTFTGSGRVFSGPDRHVLVETKGTGASTAADRQLWRLRVRPISISKYCIGTALVHPQLRANEWNRLLRSHFGWRREWTEPVGAQVR